MHQNIKDIKLDEECAQEIEHREKLCVKALLTSSATSCRYTLLGLLPAATLAENKNLLKRWICSAFRTAVLPHVQNIARRRRNKMDRSLPDVVINRRRFWE